MNSHDMPNSDFTMLYVSWRSDWQGIITPVLCNWLQREQLYWWEADPKLGGGRFIRGQEIPHPWFLCLLFTSMIFLAIFPTSLIFWPFFPPPSFLRSHIPLAYTPPPPGLLALHSSRLMDGDGTSVRRGYGAAFLHVWGGGRWQHRLYKGI